MHPGFTKIAIHDYAKIKLPDFNDIVYCKAESNYTHIYLQNNSIIVPKVLKCFESILPSDTFLRIHKSYLININFITGFKTNKIVVLKSHIDIPIARRRKSLLLKELSKNHLLLCINKNNDR
jgi:two-component system LytT family response regulator